MSMFRGSFSFCVQNVICRRLCVPSNSSQSPLPSGWKPQSDNPTPVPFAVRRTHVNNLPVYLDYKNGRARTFTIIRNIDGNIQSLESMLRDHLEVPSIQTRVDNVTGQIIIKGNYRNKTKLFLRSLGF